MQPNAFESSIFNASTSSYSSRDILQIFISFNSAFCLLKLSENHISRELEMYPQGQPSDRIEVLQKPLIKRTEL